MNPLVEAMKAKQKPANQFDETKLMELFREWHKAMHAEMAQPKAEPSKVVTQESHVP